MNNKRAVNYHELLENMNIIKNGILFMCTVSQEYIPTGCSPSAEQQSLKGIEYTS